VTNERDKVAGPQSFADEVVIDILMDWAGDVTAAVGLGELSTRDAVLAKVRQLAALAESVRSHHYFDGRPLERCLYNRKDNYWCPRERTHQVHCDEHARPGEPERHDADVVRALDAVALEATISAAGAPCTCGEAGARNCGIHQGSIGSEP
jgi:hypothetical protein